MDNGKRLNSNQLKLIAIAAMTLDHLAWTVFPGYSTEWYVILFHIIGRLTAPIMTLAICLVTFPSGWSCIATMAVLHIGINRGDFKKQMTGMMFWTVMYACVYFFFIDKVYALIQLGTCLTIPLLWLYNGERGSSKKIGKLFYVYYPLHLFLLGILRVILWGAAFSTGTKNF